ncbi:MAG: hypothetical protein ABTR07_12885 [Candidatus Competibacter denitrificans]
MMDNIAGHKRASLVCWLMAHGIRPLYTPVSGSWLTMAESIQRILAGRALAGQHPTRPEQLIQWVEAVARGWNVAPTSFAWGGKRALRRQQARGRQQARERRYPLVTHQPIPHQGIDSHGDEQSK